MALKERGKRWCFNTQQSMKRNRLAVVILSIVVHGSLLSLWITTTYHSTTYFRDVEDQMARPTTAVARQLPHWRATVDCSAFSLDCLVHARMSHRYQKYPFPPSASDDGFQITKLTEIPSAWKNVSTNEGMLSIYPHEAPPIDQQKCLDLAEKDTMQQLRELLVARVQPEPRTGMVAFTVADIHYAEDMIHDIFQSFENVVGFSQQSFFLAAIDQATVELSCKFDYPVLFWKADKGNLKDAVANAKIMLSYELVKHGRPVLFAEMDVFWLQSPILSLQKFVASPKHEIIFSTHQNNIRKPNIGVYAAKANEKTTEFFAACIQLLKEKPKTHDQFVMTQIRDLYAAKSKREAFQFSPHFDPPIPLPSMPVVNNPFLSASWSPHEVTADERPVPTDMTLAIHPLSGAPLLNPYGKKMVAKEIGAWYGFESQMSTGAGYYRRTEQYRRYIWLDGPLGSTHSLVDLDRYHDNQLLEWTMATLIAIARRTDRILVLPKLINANTDAGIYFLWTVMDHSKLEGIVEFRETNFPSNRKSWKSPEIPHQHVATTAFFRKNAHFYAQVSRDGGSKQSLRRGWDLKSLNDRLDAWVGALQGEPEIASAELLLVNTDYIDRQYLSKLAKLEHLQGSRGVNLNLSSFEEEILEIRGLLRWCHEKGYRATASKVSASHSCYGKGKSREYEKLKVSAIASE